MTKRKYGLIKQHHDSRDLQYQKCKLFRIFNKEIDLRSYCSKVEDQGDTSSCTANAFCGMVELEQRRDDKLTIFQVTDVSRLYHFYMTRKLEGTTGIDTGCTLRNTIKASYKFGEVKETDYPFIEENVTKEPPEELQRISLHNKISKYFAINSYSEMIDCLSDEHPFIVGIPVYPMFDEVKGEIIVDTNSAKGKELGWHAICIVGRIKIKGQWCFIVRNSWSEEWGDKGYGFVTEEWFKYNNLWCDAWTIRGHVF